MKRGANEQLFGLLCLLLILVGLVAGFILIGRSDRARERKLEERAHTRYVRDSIEAAVLQRDSLRAVWAQQKEEREARHAAWEKDKQVRDAARARRQQALDSIGSMKFPFDPNTADSADLAHLGLQPWMARAVIHYREKGGRYPTKQKFRQAYGMTDSLFLALQPYILLPDSASEPPFVSIKRDTILCLNKADTASLQWIRGIGRYTAIKIVEYRNRLGGYYSCEQLREISGIRNADSLMTHFVADTTLIQPLAINRLSIKALMRHPYLTFEQAKALYEHHHRKGNYHSLQDLRAVRIGKEKAFSEEELQRLRPYISFEQ